MQVGQLEHLDSRRVPDGQPRDTRGPWSTFIGKSPPRQQHRKQTITNITQHHLRHRRELRRHARVQKYQPPHRTRTDASPRECANECAKFGYYRQDDLYCRGSKELYGVKTHFIFVFVAKDPPHRVETFELDDDFKRLGQEENDDALATYAECRKTGVWLPRTHGRVIKLAAPGWLRFQKEWRA